MFENTVAIIDLVLSIVLVVTTAKWAARRSSRIKAVLFTCAVGAVYSVTTDFARGAQTAERVSLTHPLYLTLDVLVSGRAGQGVPQ